MKETIKDYLILFGMLAFATFVLAAISHDLKQRKSLSDYRYNYEAAMNEYEGLARTMHGRVDNNYLCKQR